jgi:hypothetical protein
MTAARNEIGKVRMKRGAGDDRFYGEKLKRSIK